MKNVLFLDDDEYRHNSIRPIISHDPAYTASEAIEKLKANSYEIVFLDHDLGGEVYVDSFGEKETGYTVAKWIVDNEIKIPLIVLHSLNSQGSNNQARLLKNAGYHVVQKGFTQLFDVIYEILNWKPPV